MSTPDASLLRQMADAVRDGKLVIPIARRMKLSEAGQAQTFSEEGSVGGKILLTRPFPIRRRQAGTITASTLGQAARNLSDAEVAKIASKGGKARAAKLSVQIAAGLRN